MQHKILSRGSLLIPSKEKPFPEEKGKKNGRTFNALIK